jgi:xylan 1,4-beta-xylosidase
MLRKQFLLLLSFVCINMNIHAQSTYTNPILKGDYPDPTIVRDGNDYYMTNSAFDYVPGLTVLHSKDLINWEPISFALKKYLGSVWAPDIKKHNGKYYIYFTVQQPGRGTNFVVTATSPYGPWTEPVDLNIGGIDPCMVEGAEGKLYLIMSGGKRVELSSDGLSIKPKTLTQIYTGWKYPSEWQTEGFCLEGPKVYKIGKYYYYLSAEGGTAGPPTSHMVTVARSLSIDGPWENMPTNPLIHTYNRDEHWWSKGHGSLIDTPDGKWYCVYHAYENGFYNLGRQTLMEPVHFTSDGWIASDGGDASKPLPCPMGIQRTEKMHSHLNEFRIGLDWKFYKSFDSSRVSVENGTITMKAKGKDIGSSSPLMFVSGAHRYYIEAEIELNGDVRAGLCLYYNAQFNVGTAFDKNKRYRYRRNVANGVGNSDTTHLWLRLQNDAHVVTAYWSNDGVKWNAETWGQEISGFNHNTLYDFQSVLPGIFCEGNGYAKFMNFKYKEF